ncbi:MAG: lysophospholipid acyltransferase family protein [Acidobacteriota bacterium]
MNLIRSLTCGLLTLLLAFPAIAVAAFDRGGRRSSAIVGTWARWLRSVAGAEVHHRGALDELPEGPVLFLASHESNLDIPILFSLVPDTTRFLAKRELFRIPVFGLAIGLLGFVPVERGGRRQAATRALSQASEHQRRGRSLLVFPEGTRNPEPGLLPFKKGAFRLACETRQPVVPVACLGGGRLLPPGQAGMRPGRVDLVVGQPLRPEDEPEAFSDPTRLLRLARERMLELMDTTEAATPSQDETPATETSATA